MSALARPWLVWAGALAGVTAGMLATRSSLDRVHVALAYLLVVLGASSRGGGAVGLTIAVVSFICFNFFFLPPYHTLVIADPRDWLVLAAFLATGGVAAQLLDRARNEAAAARRRTTEIDRLSALGAETLNVGRAEEALTAVAGVIRTTLGVAGCQIYLRDEAQHAATLAASSRGMSDAATAPGAEESPGPGGRLAGIPGGARLVDWVAQTGRAAIERVDGTVRVAAPRHAGDPPAAELPGLDLSGARTLLLPLRVRERTVGVLRVVHADALVLDGPQRRFLEALSYYAALGVDRVRLVAAAEHADALRQADDLKNALLASVSHDLRTPLTTIKALAHDIATGGDERAATIEQESDRLNRFVADLLDLSRIMGGALVVRPEVNAVEDLVGAALQRVAGALNGRTVDASPGGDELLVGRFDFVHSLRILVNLIENAIKYSPAGSTVEIIARRATNALELLVADRGPTIAKSATVEGPSAASRDELDSIERVVDNLSSAVTIAADRGRAQQRAAEERVGEYAALLAETSAAVGRQLEEVRLPLQILLDSHFGDLNENQEEMIGAARAAADAADADLQRLREIADIDRGALSLKREMVHPGELMSSLLPTLRAQREREGVRVAVEIAPALPRIPGDRARLREAFDLLLSERVRHAPADGEVRISVDAGNGRLIVAIEHGAKARTSAEEALALRLLAAHQGTVDEQDGRTTVTLPTGR